MEDFSVAKAALSPALLVERPDQLVTKEELIDQVWPDVDTTEEILVIQPPPSPQSLRGQ